MAPIQGVTSSRPDVSFVVIAYNEGSNIERTLRSIAGQRELGRYEVIVVDDASVDNTADVAVGFAAENPSVTVLKLPENRGRGFARATGVRAASGRCIATVDSDIVLPDDWYERCRRALDTADAVAGIAVPDGDVSYVYGRFRLEPRTVRHATTVTGSNALYRRSVFDRVSFDPSLRDGEDVVLNHAIYAAGMRAHTLEDLTVRHEESKDLRTSLGWLFRSGRGATRQFRRYREVRLPDVVFGGWVASLAASGALGLRGHGRAAPAVPLFYAMAAAAAHLHQRFLFRARDAPKAAAAVTVDAILLSTYFAGRLSALLSPDQS
jgi:glycosyltransferase involved in cell wall biosynthesis